MYILADIRAGPHQAGLLSNSKPVKRAHESQYTADSSCPCAAQQANETEGACAEQCCTCLRRGSAHLRLVAVGSRGVMQMLCSLLRRLLPLVSHRAGGGGPCGGDQGSCGGRRGIACGLGLPWPCGSVHPANVRDYIL